MKTICYLCGKEISDQDHSDDHIVPKQFIKRSQPKVKGYDYAGVLPTHAACNNRFGAEIMCQKSLQLLGVLYNPDCLISRQHKHHPDITIMAIKSECLKSFNNRDLRFFKIIDVRNKQYDEWSKPSFFEDKKRIDPFKRAWCIALSVLAKSAAAILVSRCGIPPDTSWEILCIPYFGADSATDFDKFFGSTKPFEIGVKLWVRQFENGDWFALYKYKELLVHRLFTFSKDSKNIDVVRNIFPEADQLIFKGKRLIELSEYDWSRHVISMSGCKGWPNPVLERT